MSERFHKASVPFIGSTLFDQVFGVEKSWNAQFSVCNVECMIKIFERSIRLKDGKVKEIGSMCVYQSVKAETRTPR